MFPEKHVLLVTVRGGLMLVSRYVQLSPAICLFVILAALACPPAARGADRPERKTVVLLYPDPRLLPESIALERGVRSTLEPALASGIDFYT
jgi:hypothetical protein